MLHLLAVVFFIVLPILIVWRLFRAPFPGDIYTQLMLRGIVAGLTGGTIGATLSSYIFGIHAYGIFGYIFWLLFTAIFGTIFTFIIAAVQKTRLNLNLLARFVIGGFLGMAAVSLWIATVRPDPNEINWFSKGVICMIVVTGVMSGILANIPKKAN